MTGTHGPTAWRGLIAILLAGGVLAACSPSGGEASDTTPPSTTASGTTASGTTAPTTAAPSTEGQVTVPDTTALSNPTAGTSHSTPADSTTPSTPTSSAAAVPRVSTVPAAGSAAVSPVEPISVRVSAGTLQSVTLQNAATGATVPGTLAADKRSWSVTPELGYAKEYRLTSVTVDADGTKRTVNSTFSTLAPDNQTDATVFPRDGMKVGVGQPVAITFDEPVPDREAAEKAITITTTPRQTGAFHWLSDTEVRWRPQVYWKSGSTVKIAVDVYGAHLGDGLYGQRDEAVTFTVGDAMIATVDDDTKTMVVTKNGTKVKEFPVSLGSDKYPSYNGVHVVAESYDEKIMDSSTWGLTGAGAYRTRVEYAVRISASGEFVHAAPWSVAQQGNTNVSHGCVNMSTENAKWFYDNFTYGDIVDVKNTVGPDLEIWDGYGDWQLSWDDYRS